MSQSDEDVAAPTVPAGGPPATPAVAAAVFGDRLATAERFAAVLASRGVTEGLIGPREVPRLWQRHLLNCAVVSELLPSGARVIDVGSGAGLPGIALAVRRPDLMVVCVESMRRRTDFLSSAAAELGVADQIQVVRGRIEEPAVRSTLGDVHWVTARAVAPLGRLMEWCLPVIEPGGVLLALKGANAEAELADVDRRLSRFVAHKEIVECGVGVLDEATRVIAITRRAPARQEKKGRR